ncbi:MAG: DUF5330 domain-containing protein [Proteobacteria bacterium]|nr:DUF5330 domain-containing protein [Pseudomonadota bacterium]
MGQFSSNKAKSLDVRRTGLSAAHARVTAMGKINTEPGHAGEHKGSSMKFLLKAAFWLTVVLILLPTGRSEETRTANQPQVSTLDAVGAASAAISDARDFCARKPEACAVGSQLATALGHKAQAGAKMIYEFLSDKLGKNGSETGATPAATVRSATLPTSQDTLSPADLAPAWRGPARRAAEAKSSI